MTMASHSGGLRLLTLGAALVLGGAGVSGCATTVVALGASAAAVAISDKTAGATIDDTAATAEIKAKMLQGKGYTLSDVHVAVSEGFVLLAGSTPTPQDRIEAERRAWQVAAVRNVANEIKIGSARSLTASLQDKMIGTQVRAKFLRSNVKALNYTIETHEGVVYLLGIARTQYELGDAVEEARTVGGVQKVVSYVRVQDRPEIAQPETAQQAATRRAEEMGLKGGPQPQQTYGKTGPQPDYAEYDLPAATDRYAPPGADPYAPPIRSAAAAPMAAAPPPSYAAPAYSQPNYAQPSYDYARPAAPKAPPQAPDPTFGGSPATGQTLGAASDTFAGEMRPMVPNAAPAYAPSYSAPTPNYSASSAAPSYGGPSYNGPSYGGSISNAPVASNSGPVVLTPQ